jgi:hypothetical protein
MRTKRGNGRKIQQDDGEVDGADVHGAARRVARC